MRAAIAILIHTFAAALAAGATAAETALLWRFGQAADASPGGVVEAVAPADGRFTASRAVGHSVLAGAQLTYESVEAPGEALCLRFANPSEPINDSGVFLRVPDHPALSGHAGDGGGFEDLRVFARVRLRSLGRAQNLIRKTNGSTETGYILALTPDNRVRFAVGGRAGHGSVTSGGFRLEPERWYEIEGTWDGRRIELAIDGREVTSPASFRGRLDNTTGPLTFGGIDRDRNSTGQFLDGWLDEVRISGSFRPKPEGVDAMAQDPSVTAWGIPVKRMWFCPPHDWGKPALGIPMAKGVRHAPIFEPELEEGAYNHHPELTWHRGRFHAMWSNNMLGEDMAGQRVLFAVSDDVTTWPEARLLFPQPGESWNHRVKGAREAGRRGFYLTAMKWIPLDDRLFAVATFDSVRGRVTPLVREVHADGSLGEIFAIRAAFERAEQEHFPFEIVVPEGEPYLSLSRRLLALYLTPEYLPSWNFGIEDLLPRPRMVEGHPMCEWSVHRAADGRYVMLARDLRSSHRMYGAVSDSPVATSFPPLEPTDIPDSPSKAVTVNLSGDTVLLIGNQLAQELDNLDSRRHYERDPLTISISPDGYRFERQLVLRWEGGRRWRVPTGKIHGRGPGCQYPAALVHEGVLYVIYSIGKEDVGISWVEIEKLGL